MRGRLWRWLDAELFDLADGQGLVWIFSVRPEREAVARLRISVFIGGAQEGAKRGDLGEKAQKDKGVLFINVPWDAAGRLLPKDRPSFAAGDESDCLDAAFFFRKKFALLCKLDFQSRDAEEVFRGCFGRSVVCGEQPSQSLISVVKCYGKHFFLLPGDADEYGLACKWMEHSDEVRGGHALPHPQLRKRIGFCIKQPPHVWRNSRACCFTFF